MDDCSLTELAKDLGLVSCLTKHFARLKGRPACRSSKAHSGMRTIGSGPRSGRVPRHSQQAGRRSNGPAHAHQRHVRVQRRHQTGAHGYAGVQVSPRQVAATRGSHCPSWARAEGRPPQNGRCCCAGHCPSWARTRTLLIRRGRYNQPNSSNLLPFTRVRVTRCCSLLGSCSTLPYLTHSNVRV